MQRKALKQLNKVTQWTSEKVFSGEKTQFSSEFQDFELEIEPARMGIERLHATSASFFSQISKLKLSADPYPPSGATKEKLSVSEALGLVMIDYGNDAGGSYGDGLVKYGRARCKLANAQQLFSERLKDGYITEMESAIAAVNEYKVFRKKLDSRRLTLDSAISRTKGTKKESYALEQEVELAQQRFDEAEEETKMRIVAIQEQEAEQFAALAELLDAEFEYFSRSKDILEELRNNFPSVNRESLISGRPRTKSTASARSFSRFSRPNSASDDEDVIVNRTRSDSINSTGKSKGRSILPSLGSFGKKSGLMAASAANTASRPFRKEKYDNISDEELRHVTLGSDVDSYFDEMDMKTPKSSSGTNRARAHSSTMVPNGAKPSLHRSLTSPSPIGGRYVKVLYDFEGLETDELPLLCGQVVKVKSVVSDDWFIGECNGLSGLFPRAYTKEHTPDQPNENPPQPAAPRPRNLPPLADGSIRRTLPPSLSDTTNVTSSLSKRPIAPPSIEDYGETGSETEPHNCTDDDDIDETTMTTSQSSTKNNVRSRASSIKRTAPPPPPSRRSASSTNISTLVSSVPGSSGYLSPPLPIFGRSRSSTFSPRASQTSSPSLEGSPFTGGSPFGGSDEEGDANVGSTGFAARSLSHGLGDMHVGSSSGAITQPGNCFTCGCDDFTQNVFKSRGTCSTCFHQH